MRGPIPPRRTCPHEDGCGNPSPPVVLADAWTHPHPLSSRIPLIVPADAWTHPPPVVLADAWTHPHPLSSRMRGPIPPHCPRGCVDPSRPVVLAECVDSRRRAVPPREDGCGNPSPSPPRQSPASLTPLPLLSSWQAHDGDGASSADRSPCPPGCWTHPHPLFPRRVCPREDGCENPSPSPPTSISRPPYPSSSSFFLAGARRRRRLFG